MADIMKGIKPENVFRYFEEICSIPHGSGNEKAISDYCVAFARSNDLWVRQDSANNVIIKKAASAGYEHAPGVILQGHMDMVCEKTADCPKDMTKEGLDLFIDGDFLRAKDTTLGGDDGIAVAIALAILADNDIEHPALTVIITTDEEVGMDGARALDLSDIEADYMINIDNEKEGEVIVSCAGGLKAQALFDIRRVTMDGKIGHILISGLKGGHSGQEIDKGRANADKLLGRLLYRLNQETFYGLISLEGGTKDNAIPRESKALIVADPDEMNRINEIAASFARDIADEYAASDSDIFITIEFESRHESVAAIHPADTARVIFMLNESPNGVQGMSMELKGLVESSLNLGILSTSADQILFSWAIRSSRKSCKYEIEDRIRFMTEFLGGQYSAHGDYPNWAYRPESKLCNLYADVYLEMFGEKPEVAAIHAGLECGLIGEKLPNLDIIAIGPDIHDIHTPEEHLSISSTERTYRLICELIKRLK